MTIITKDNGTRELPFSEKRLEAFIQNVLEVKDRAYIAKVTRLVSAKDRVSAQFISDKLTQTALENIDIVSPEWKYVAAKVLLNSLYKEASKNRSYASDTGYGDFLGLQKTLASKNIYSPDILASYSEFELRLAGEIIDAAHDKLFDYSGLKILADRYLAKDRDGAVYELPQERWIVIALHLMKDEAPNYRMDYVNQAYWAMANLFMTVATPTLANAGRSHGQLSSCFIDTMDDSLDGIFNVVHDSARVSKDGGGIGVYVGKVRTKGSSIKGFPGASGGTVPWIKILNDVAVSVDQLGNRPGAIAVYQNVFSNDIFAHLDLKLNNGDARYRAHDIFTGVCVPDLFMEQVEKRGDWYTFDSHEVKQVMGFELDDFYDEERGSGSFREKYDECVSCPQLKMKQKHRAIDVMIRIMKAQLETGTPYMFYRDEVNRMNPNKHAGMVYCSNLC